ncbi:MAG TPA: hypothetical protein V6C72_14855, partial [Chroococcales cyanobacterium]
SSGDIHLVVAESLDDLSTEVTDLTEAESFHPSLDRAAERSVHSEREAHEPAAVITGDYQVEPAGDMKAHGEPDVHNSGQFFGETHAEFYGQADAVPQAGQVFHQSDVVPYAPADQSQVVPFDPNMYHTQGEVVQAPLGDSQSSYTQSQFPEPPAQQISLDELRANMPKSEPAVTLEPTEDEAERQSTIWAPFEQGPAPAPQTVQPNHAQGSAAQVLKNSSASRHAEPMKPGPGDSGLFKHLRGASEKFFGNTKQRPGEPHDPAPGHPVGQSEPKAFEPKHSEQKDSEQKDKDSIDEQRSSGKFKSGKGKPPKDKRKKTR